MARSGRSRSTTDGTRSWVAGVVRSGLVSGEELTDVVLAAVGEDHRDLDGPTTAAAWIAEAEQAWREDASSWPGLTDFDRLQQVFAALEADGVVVLQGCSDHWAARDELVRRVPTPRAVAWFTAPDVWHAVDEGMLEVNLWHATTANAAPGDALLDEVLAGFAAAGLPAHFDEGRIEVAASWQRRPA
ncbi:MAG: hypothetical protein JWQ74_94 [Marmoricola sp.]|nr:hypothetical protein [Marmoricola sp.]